MGKSILRFLNKFGLFLRFYNDSSMLHIHYIYYNVDNDRVKEYYSEYPDLSGIQIWFKFNKTGFKWKAMIPEMNYYKIKCGFENHYDTFAFINNFIKNN